MKLNEILKDHRNKKRLSQEKVAELVGVSRQAVTKWENGQSMPSSENLIAVASVYGVSIDDLAEAKSFEEKKSNTILHSNLTLIAIILQAAALNVCIQPISTVEYKSPYYFLLSVKIVPLLACSVWMAYNLKYEKNAIQYGKNIKIELLYCSIQAVITLFAFYFKLGFLGTLFILITCMVYIFIINSKYMNRQLTKKKDESFDYLPAEDYELVCVKTKLK